MGGQTAKVCQGEASSTVSSSAKRPLFSSPRADCFLIENPWEVFLWSRCSKASGRSAGRVSSQSLQVMSSVALLQVCP